MIDNPHFDLQVERIPARLKQGPVLKISCADLFKPFKDKSDEMRERPKGTFLGWWARPRVCSAWSPSCRTWTPRHVKGALTINFGIKIHISKTKEPAWTNQSVSISRSLLTTPFWSPVMNLRTKFWDCIMKPGTVSGWSPSILERDVTGSVVTTRLRIYRRLFRIVTF